MSEQVYVSMKDIAEKVGLHVSTVSLALKDSPKLRAQTKEKILAAAHLLGYRHNPYISTLMRSRRSRRIPQTSPVIGYITSHDHRDEWKQVDVLHQFFHGCCEMATQRGYRMETFWRKDPSMTPKRFSRILYNRGIQGIILAPCPELDAHVEMEWELFSPVAIGYSIHHPRLHRVTNNHFLSGIQVMDYCRKIGARRIGFVVPKLHTVRLQHRWLGAFLAKQFTAGIPAEIPPLITDQGEWGAPTILEWYYRHRPDVIVGSFGSSIKNWLASAGIQTPRDVQLVSLTCPDENHEVTGIYENSHGIARKATEMVISMIEQTEKGLPAEPWTISLEGAWNPGTTVLDPSIPGVSEESNLPLLS
jgi:DNA-binding LacI/PurR family transcriptional regulator